MCALVSLSAQWTTISCADHFPGAGFHLSASAGTLASARLSSVGPWAYRSIIAARSAVVKGIGTSWLAAVPPLRDAARGVRGGGKRYSARPAGDEARRHAGRHSHAKPLVEQDRPRERVAHPHGADAGKRAELGRPAVDEGLLRLAQPRHRQRLRARRLER